MKPLSPTRLCEAYAALQAACFPDGRPPPPAPPRKEDLQGQWAAGLLPRHGETCRHGSVGIVDPGRWNRREGPDFLRAELELGGQRLKGDVVLDLDAEDWEHADHGSDPAYGQVVLHVVFHAPGPDWYTRDAAHREVPLLCLNPRRLGQLPPPTVPCPLAAMPASRLEELLKAAAAHRWRQKRAAFRHKAEQVGEPQAWYEAWAETLGYQSNQTVMLTLARRAPLQELAAGHEEALLFGAAGFLVPSLPPQASQEARAHHRALWDAWWPCREAWALEGSRRLPWVMSPVRPLNHPHRRVAALAALAMRWPQIFPLLQSGHASRLEEALARLTHPYWSCHCTLPSHALQRPAALVGRQRVQDFLVNHLYAYQGTEAAWHTYLALRMGPPPAPVSRIAQALLGEREDVRELLRHSYAQQGLLQLQADFGLAPAAAGEAPAFPAGLARWPGA